MSNEPSTTEPPGETPQPEGTNTEPVTPVAGGVGGGAEAAGPTREDIESMRAQLAHMGQSLQLVMSALGQVSTQRQVPAQAAAITDEQIQAAFDEGKGPQMLRQLLAQERQTVVRDYVEPLQRTGLGAIAQLTKKQAASEMPYYERFKDEIDRHIASLPPEAQLNPDAYTLAHNYVVGRPENLNKIIDERVQAAVRSRSSAGDLGEGAGRGVAGGGGGKQVPTPEELFGAEVGNSIRQLGLTPDSWAKKLGYSDWADYLTKTEMEEDHA